MWERAAVRPPALDLKQLDVVTDVALVAVNHANRVGSYHRKLVIRKVDDLVGSPRQRRRVAGDKVLAAAHADHQWATQPARHQSLGPVAEHDRQAVGSSQLRQALFAPPPTNGVYGSGVVLRRPPGVCSNS